MAKTYLPFVDDKVILAEDEDDANYMFRKLARVEILGVRN